MRKASLLVEILVIFLSIIPVGREGNGFTISFFACFMSNNRVSVERFQSDIFFSRTEVIYRYNYILKIRS